MTKKNFNQLTAKGQQARLNKYAQQRDAYGQAFNKDMQHGLFNLIRVADHGEAKTKNGKLVHRFGYLVYPAGAQNTTEGLDAGKAVWLNELVHVTPQAKAVIDHRLGLKQALTTKKAVLLSVDYSVAGAWRNVESSRQYGLGLFVR